MDVVDEIFPFARRPPSGTTIELFSATFTAMGRVCVDWLRIWKSLISVYLIKAQSRPRVVVVTEENAIWFKVTNREESLSNVRVDSRRQVKPGSFG